MSGDLPRAIERMRTYDETASPAYMMHWAEIPHLTKCRVQIAEGSAPSIESALSRLEQYERENRTVHDRLQLIAILALKALALHGVANTGEALTALREAVTLAQPGGVIRPIVELGLPVVSLLEKMEPGTYDRSFIADAPAERDLADAGHDGPGRHIEHENHGGDAGGVQGQGAEDGTQDAVDEHPAPLVVLLATPDGTDGGKDAVHEHPGPEEHDQNGEAGRRLEPQRQSEHHRGDAANEKDPPSTSESI
jgi:hypothetical protein